ncbi:MAG TPA: hypothetical protein VHH73_17080, partial [Verrucomicrobiae bacterium]|nr:hypothetical protein [Verrucomicrobiae bacterium]
PSFHVTKIEPWLELVNTHLGSRFVHYVGSSTQCGCGFRQESALYRDLADIEPDDERESAENHAALVAYLRGLPPAAYPLKLYSCWNGDEGEPCAYEIECGLADLLAEDFAFRERQLTVINAIQG